MRIGPARTNIFGHLGMPHGQGPEQETPVKAVGLALQGLFQFLDFPLNFTDRRCITGEAIPQFNQRIELRLPSVLLLVTGQLVCKGVIAWKRRGKYDPGVIAQLFRQHPSLRQFTAQMGCPVLHY